MSEPYWIALGAAGAVDYKGDWAAGTQYLSGDVARLNGIDYLAVNPSLGQTPPAVSAAAGRELAYTEITAPVSVTATTEAAANTVISAPAVTFDGSPVLIQFFAPYATTHNVTNATIYAVLFEDGVSLGRLSILVSPAAATMYGPLNVVRRMVPSAGSHTYTIRAFVSTGTGSVVAGTGGAGLYVPAFIRITKVVT